MKQTVTIQNKKGLHARAAAKFVKMAAEFQASIRVTRLGEKPEGLCNEDVEWTVNGRSILGLMMLGCEPGVALELEATGDDEEALLAALAQLVDNKFDEGE